jgi:ABC-type antimicrobial peptide transport system permease subunit
LYSIESLRRRRRRVILTVIGVALSIALTVTMFSIGEGLRRSTDALVEDTEVDLFIVPKGSDYIFFTADFPKGTELSERITDDLGAEAETVLPRYMPKRELYLRSVDDVEAPPVGARPNGVIPRLVGDISGFSIKGGEYFTVEDDPFSEDPAYLGHNYTPDAFTNFTGEIVINQALARELKLGTGDSVVLSAYRSFEDNLTVVVRGVYVADFEGAEHRSFHVHLSELQYLLRRWDDPVSEILVDLREGANAEVIKKRLEEDYEYSPLLTVSTDADIFDKLDTLYDTFEGFASLIALITIAVALLFIVTVMIISVKERTREIGALRAIGFSRLSIFRLVLQEGFLISIAGFALGLLFGYIDAWVLDEYLRQTITGIPAGIHVTQITGLVVLEVTLVGMVIGAVAGLLPAYWATRVNIADTLRHE